MNSADKDGRGPYCGIIVWPIFAGYPTVPAVPYSSNTALDTTLSPKLCAANAIMTATLTLESVFENYDPMINGHNGLHCYANCLIARNCGYNLSDFERLLNANLEYELCTKEEQVCDKWCSDIKQYEADVASDFRADVIGICGGLAGVSCERACISQTLRETGPEDKEEGSCFKDKEKHKWCKENFKNNPDFVPDETISDIYDKLFPAGTRDYNATCPFILEEIQ